METVLTENPFWGRDAETFSPGQAVERFVPNRVWNEVRTLDSHRLVVGGVGTGKSILLKRLSAPAMRIRPAFLTDSPFFAVYVNLQHLSFLDPIMSADDDAQGIRSARRDELGIVDWSFCLLLCDAVLSAVDDHLGAARELGSDSFDQVRRCVSSLLDADGDDHRDLRGIVGEKLRALRRAVSKDPEAAVEQLRASSVGACQDVARDLAEDLGECLDQPSRIVFLLDQYEAVHPEVRFALNSMMLRSTRSAYVTVVAARPFAMPVYHRSGRLTPKEDFSISLVEYLPPDGEKYRLFLKEVVGRLLANRGLHIGPEDLLTKTPALSDDEVEQFRKNLGMVSSQRSVITQLVGFDALAELSSGSVRAFLDLCREAVSSCGEEWWNGIPPRKQLEAVRVTSIGELARIRALPVEPHGAIVRLMKVIRDKVRRRDPVFVRNPDQVRYDADSLYDFDAGSGALTKEGNLVRVAFENAAFRFPTAQDVGFELPNHWRIANLVCPALRLSPFSRGSITVGRSDFRDVLAIPMGRSEPANVKDVEPLRRVFFSSSFGMSEEHFNQLYEAFANRDVTLRRFEGSGGGLIEQVRQDMAGCDMTLIDISDMRPNCLLEMGLSIGVHRPVLLVREIGHREVDGAVLVHPVIRWQTSNTYSWASRDLDRLVEWVISHWRRPRESYELLERAMSNPKKRLRVKAGRRTCFLCWSWDDNARWTARLPELRARLETARIKLLVRTKSSDTASLQEPEELVWYISKASHIVIDTTTYGGGGDARQGRGDLGMAFALGFAFGTNEGRHVLRVDIDSRKSSSDDADDIGMWPVGQGFHRSLKDGRELADAIIEWIGPPKGRGK